MVNAIPRYTPPVRVLDLSDNPRIKIIEELLVEASRAREPTDVFKVFGPRMWKIRPIEYFISLSTRNLPEGQYKITRRYGVEEMRAAAERNDGTLPSNVNVDPWKTFQQLPAYREGVLGAAIAKGTPKILKDLDLSNDPVLGGDLAEFKSALAIPLLDNGRPLNWSIQFRRDPNAYNEQSLEDAMLLSNLIGAMTRNLVAIKEVERLNKALNAQFEEVARVQQSLLPEKLPQVPGLAIATSYLTSDQAGGDYYDFLPMPDGRLGVLVADVSGHGAGAATIMAMMRAILHCYSGGDGSASSVLRFVNHRLLGSRLEGNFVTAFFGVYDPAKARLNYASAGHNPPRLYTAATGSIRGIEDAATLPLGISDDMDVWSEDVQLSPGDAIVLYTDGITEAFSGDGNRRMFGVEKLDEAIRSTGGRPDDIVESIHRSLFTHTQARTRADDQTLVAMQYVGPDRCLFPPVRSEV